MAKQRFKDENGRIFCEACDFDFQETYGEDYIEAHHILPLGEIKEGQIETKIKDIVLLCCNCHKMVHKKRPWLKSMEEIKSLLFKDSHLKILG